MMKWMIIVALLITGSILGYMYVLIENDKLSSQLSQLPPPPDLRTIRITDGYRDGVHRLTGTIKLPHSCYSVQADASIDPARLDHITINLKARDIMLEQPVCAQITTRYPFQVIEEAPEAITVTLMLNDQELPSAVTQTSWQNPSGNITNTEPNLQ